MEKLRSNVSFLRLFFGRLITNAGDSLYFIAAMWLVYELTGSTLYTGLMGFLGQFPRTLQFLTGPLVDRWRLRRVLVGTQIFQGVCVLLIPLAFALNRLTVWLVLVLMPILKMANQFVYPAQNAALPRIVEEENLVQANSMFSMAYQGANAVFNAVGGVLIAGFGAITLFVADSASFAIAALLFFGVTIPAVDGSESSADPKAREGDSETTESDSLSEDISSYLDDLREGVAYVRGSVVVSIVVGVMVTNFAFGAMLAVLPSFANTIGGAETYGLLMSLYAGGVLVGTLGATLVEEFPYGWVCIGAFITSGSSLFGSLAAPSWILTLLLFFAAFVPIGAFSVLFWSMLQSAIDERLLGRVTSLVTSFGAVMLPVGSLVGGGAADHVGDTTIMAGLAVGLFALAGYFFLHTRLRTLPAIVETDEAVLQIQSPE